jgi:Rrf2 family protein
MSTIFHLSEAVSLGLHSMVMIAQANELINATIIAEKTCASRNHLAKVLQRLVKQKLVKATRGPAGGYVLNRKPEDISLLEIYESIEGPIETSTCPLDRPTCPFTKCIMGDVVSKVSTEFQNYLKNNTLRDFI